MPFAPDERMRTILEEAAIVGNAASRVIVYRNRDKSFAAYEGKFPVTALAEMVLTELISK